jgi:hypothetical protein
LATLIRREKSAGSFPFNVSSYFKICSLQKLSIEDRHALRQERVPAILAELHVLLLAMQASGTIPPKSIAGNAISYTLKRWEKLTRFIKHPVIELSTNWAENSMRPIGIPQTFCPCRSGNRDSLSLASTLRAEGSLSR